MEHFPCGPTFYSREYLLVMITVPEQSQWTLRFILRIFFSEAARKGEDVFDGKHVRGRMKNLFMCKPIKFQIAVIDGTAWFAYALMALSLYVFRQPSYVLDQGPFSHRWENLPKIFIPNNLTGPEIGRALRTSSKAQILAENNKVGTFFLYSKTIESFTNLDQDFLKFAKKFRASWGHCLS